MVSLMNIDSNGVEYGIVVVDVIILLFQLIFRLYLNPSSENDGLNSSNS